MKSKVTKSEQWPKPDQHGNLKFNISLEDGVEGVYTCKKGNELVVGQEYDLEVTDAQWGNGKGYKKISKPKKEFSKEGWKPHSIQWNEILRMARSNGCHASWKIKGKRDEGFVNRIVGFITHEITPAPIELNSETHSLIISRMSATKNILEGHTISWTEDSYLKECLSESRFIQGS